VIRSLKRTDQQVVGKTVQASVEGDELYVNSYWETTSLVLHRPTQRKTSRLTPPWRRLESHRKFNVSTTT
jgi:hypothetical protein